jgi:hypothetical protein
VKQKMLWKNCTSSEPLKCHDLDLPHHLLPKYYITVRWWHSKG